MVLSSRPFPTNVWWQNLVNDDGNGEMVNTVNPYIVKVKGVNDSSRLFSRYPRCTGTDCT